MVNTPTDAVGRAIFLILTPDSRLTMTSAARKVLVALAAVGAIAIAVWLLRPNTTAAKVAVPVYEVPPAQSVEALKKLPVGMSGCLAAACHGGPPEKTLAGQIDDFTWQSSGACWVAADPHVNAYNALTDPHRRVTAKQIMAEYAKKTNTPNKPATEETRCVACHTSPALARPELMNDPNAIALRNEGVSCESCHGNAGKWVGEHTTWQGDRDKVYNETGMVRLYDIGERAKNCAGCHVGAPADPERGLPVRDMNHDMIAAGHPRLNFDFAEYVRRLPRHWQEKDRTANKPRPLNRLKEWYVGRAAHAEAACRLLKDRAERAEKGDEKTPWPEFAEFNCASCHHGLIIDDKSEQYANWRRSETYLNDRPPGSMPWQMIWPMTNAPGIPSPKRRESRLWPVLDVIEKPRPTKMSDAKKVAGETADKLHAFRLSLVAMPDADAERQARGFFPSGAPFIPEWDTATQLFFGYAAMDRMAKPSKEMLDHYNRAVAAFRKQQQYPTQKQNWADVKQALEAIRPK